MAIRIPWSDEEAALLLHTLIKVLNNEMPRKEAITSVSRELRALAVRNGIEIDDKYRNENGIALQMSKLEYVFTDGKSGLAVQTRWYFRIVDIYNTDSVHFNRLWKENAEMSNDNNILRDNLFCRTSSKQVNNVLVDAQEDWSDVPVTDEADAQVKFSAWMLSKGMAKSTVNLYQSSLRQCGEFAKKRGLLANNILLILQSDDVVRLQNCLNSNPEFITWNTHHHHRFGAALKKYIEYRMDENVDISVPAYATEQSAISAVEQKAVPSIADEIAKKYTLILRDEFPDGLRQNIIHVKKFIQRYEERFGTIEATKDNLLDQLRIVGVVRDDRIYPKQDNDQRTLMDEIYEDITGVFDNGGTCVYLSTLLERYAQQLSAQLGVYNEDALQALLLERNPEYYMVRYGYVCQSADKADAMRDVLCFMQKSHKPLNYDEIQQTLWYIPIDRIKHALVMTDSLVNVDQETYFYAPNLPVSTEELQTLVHVMNREIDARGFLVGQHLKALIDQNCPSAAIDTAFMKDWGIRKCLSYILRDNFEFTGALVSKKGHEITIAEAYQDFCKEHEILKLPQLKDFAAEVNVPIYWDSVLSVMVRVSPDEMWRADRVRFDVAATDQVLDTLCSGDYIPIQEIRLFLQFPLIAVPWNGFVLECYLKNHSKQFRLEQVSVTENGFYGVMVRNSSKYQDYEQVVVDMLAHSQKWTDQKSALDLIVSQGYQARRRWTNFAPVIKKAELLREKMENN